MAARRQRQHRYPAADREGERFAVSQFIAAMLAPTTTDHNHPNDDAYHIQAFWRWYDNHPYAPLKGPCYAVGLWLQEMTMTKEPHQGRVVSEKRELDEKITKLEAFLERELPAPITLEQLSLLRVQLPAMRVYSWILGERIAAFPDEADHG
jgi:hypothetical protein